MLNLKTPYASVADLFDGQRYRLQDFWQGRQETGRKMSPLEKAIVETDEKVGLILMLQKGTLIRPLPKDGSVKPLPLSKIRAELIYNRIPFSKCLFPPVVELGMRLEKQQIGLEGPVLQEQEMIEKIMKLYRSKCGGKKDAAR